MTSLDGFLRDNKYINKITIAGEEFNINYEVGIHSLNGLNKYFSSDYSGAVLDFTRAINAQPHNQNLYIFRGTVLEDFEDYLSAKNDFKKALEIDPNNYLAAYRLGMVHSRLQDLDNAILLLEISNNNSEPFLEEELGQNNIFFVSREIILGNFGNFLLDKKRFREGFSILEEAMEIAPTYTVPYLSKGIALFNLGYKDLGISFTQKAMELGNDKAKNILQRMLTTSV